MITITNIENAITETLGEHYNLDNMRKFLRRVARSDIERTNEPFRDVSLEQGIVATKFRNKLKKLSM